MAATSIPAAPARAALTAVSAGAALSSSSLEELSAGASPLAVGSAELTAELVKEVAADEKDETAMLLALSGMVAVAVSTTRASMTVWVRVKVDVVVPVASPSAKARAGRKTAPRMVATFMMTVVKGYSERCFCLRKWVFVRAFKAAL